MKILVSLFGHNEDFTGPKENPIFNPNGFTAMLHEDIYESYQVDHHIILTTVDKSGEKTRILKTMEYQIGEYLREFKSSHRFEIKNSGIDKSELQNFEIIESRIRSFFSSLDPSDEILVVAGTGPTAYSMALCTLNLAMKDRFGLFVLQRREYSSDSKRSTLQRIKPFISPELDNALRKYHTSLELPENIYIDEITKAEYEKAKQYAKAIDMNILILGETGCGKDRMAEFIYKNSPTSKKTYKAINCASLSDEVLYSELFGHKKGSFTGANDDRKGIFEECNGGTLFLDEIGDISPFMQQSLLRAIENKEIRRLGSNEILKNVDVRIIAATNVNLYQKCKEGKFRWDLYYRLSNPEIVLRSYRSRSLDQRKKVLSHYLDILNAKWDKQLVLNNKALEIIENYPFPGNFREIYNTLNALYPLLVKEITPEHLPERFIDLDLVTDDYYDNVLKSHCLKVYTKNNFDMNRTTKALGYKNSTQLKNKFIEWGIYKYA